MTQIEQKNYVTFLSPGTFFDESDTKPVDGWSIDAALKYASEIVQRYNAKPYAFYFETRVESQAIDDGLGGKLEVQPRTILKSGLHYIDGKALNLEQAKAEYGADSTLVWNMEVNHYSHVCETTNSYKHVGILNDNDVIVDSKTGQMIWWLGKDSV